MGAHTPTSGAPQSTDAAGSAPRSGADAVAGAHGLGPHAVGVRVVVRRLIPGRTGPTGGPAFTDILGVLERWEGHALVRREDGSSVEIPHQLIVSGKPVPPRPSPLLRAPAREVQLRVRRLWPGERAEVGDWLLQTAPPHPDAATGRHLRRTNSALAYGSPGVAVEEAAALVQRWYAERDRPPLACVAFGSGEQEALRSLGWVEPRDLPDARVSVQLASLSRMRRALRAIGRTHTLDCAEGQVEVEVAEQPIEGLEGLEGVVRLEARGPAVAGRLEISGDQAYLHHLHTAPASRRGGRALCVLDALADRAAERGVTTMALHVVTSNLPAVALYERLGFVEHHTTIYLAPRG